MVRLREHSHTGTEHVHHTPYSYLDDIHTHILIIGIEEYGDILVFMKFETNWMVRLREHSHTGTQHMSITRHT